MKTLITILILTITSQLHAQQNNISVLGHVDFYELLNATPILQTSPEAAFQYVCNKSLHCEGDSQLEIQYEAFKKQKEFYANQFESNYALKAQDFNSKNSTDSYKKQANQNDLIQSMGGMDKVMQMSDAERETTAKKAMASKMTSSKLSPFTEAEMQRMMTDPEYAKQMSAKYNNMTAQEMEGIINKKIVARDLDDSKEAYEQRLKYKKNTINIQDVNLFVNNTTARLAEAYEACILKIHQAKSTSGNHEELDNMYKQLYEKIPLLENQIQGKYKDPVKLKNLKIEYALKHKNRATLELSEVKTEFIRLESIINKVISDYKSFLETNGYKVNDKMSSLFDGTNTELSLLQVEGGIIGAIDKLAQISYDEDSIASDYEQVYQLVLHGEYI